MTFRILLSSPSKPPIKQVIDSGVIPRFIQLAQQSQHPQLQYESLCTLLNIASGPDGCTEHILYVMAVQCIHWFIKIFIDYTKEKREIYWSISNVTAGPINDKILVLNRKLLKISCVILHDAPYEVCKEALWAISNATTNPDKTIINPLVEYGVI